MKSSVIIKGNKYGFLIVLDPSLPFEDLLKETALKFRKSIDFFNDTRPVAVSFEGRFLSGEEQNRLIDVIVENSGLNICCLIDGAKAYETRYARIMQEAGLTGDLFLKNRRLQKEEAAEAAGKAKEDGLFYIGTLKRGQALTVERSIVILGDISRGAWVKAGGNIVILGHAAGTMQAGYPGRDDAYIAGLYLHPEKLQIGSHYIRRPECGTRAQGRQRKSDMKKAALAFVKNETIFIKTITETLINDVSIN